MHELLGQGGITVSNLKKGSKKGPKRGPRKINDIESGPCIVGGTPSITHLVLDKGRGVRLGLGRVHPGSPEKHFPASQGHVLSRLRAQHL